MTCPMALILPCLFQKYLPCRTLSLLAWSPLTARKLRSTGFKWLIPNHLPTTADPWQNPMFTSDQAPSAQITFECYFSCFSTQHHHFHITTRRIYDKLWEMHRTSVPVDLDYTHTQRNHFHFHYSLMFLQSFFHPPSLSCCGNLVKKKKKSENNHKVESSWGLTSLWNTWENSSAEERVWHRKETPFLGPDEVRCPNSAGD